MKLEIKDLVCGYGSKVIVNKSSLELNSGEALCLLGPNGVGKTTLFKTILGFLKPIGGEILINNKNIHNLTRKELAQIIGYVPQAHVPPFPFTVFDVVLMGRNAHIGMFGSPSNEDIEKAEEMLNLLNIYYLKDKVYTEVSGGERQLVLIARALAQEPELLIMDEPTSNLDFGNSIRVLEHINNLVKEKDIALIMTTHSPNHAFLCASKVAIMKDGEIISVGKPDSVINEKSLKMIYGIDVNIMTLNNNGTVIKSCVPITI